MPGESNEAGNAPRSNGRITWKEFYQAVTERDAKITDRINTMEQRIMDKLDRLVCKEDLKEVKEDVEKVKRIAYGWNGINTLATAIATYLGFKQ